MWWVANNRDRSPIVTFVDVSESISGCRQAAAVLLEALEGPGLDDAAARRPSLLPGWSVGHLLTHLARNADSHRRMIEAGAEDRVADQYPGGPAQRDGEIEAGAHRPAQELLDDLRTAELALQAAWDRVPPEVWARDSRRWGTQPWPLAEQPFLRWREVALHSTDLGVAGLTPDLWADAYVDHELRRQLAALAPRLPGRLAVDVEVADRGWDVVVMGSGPGQPEPLATAAGTSRQLLGWLVGRGTAPAAWPRLTAWPAVP